MFHIMFAFLSLIVPIENSTATSSITLTVNKIETPKGYVVISLYRNNPKDFPDESAIYKKIKVKASGKSVKYTFKNLPKGDYAIIAFHDKNADGDCNTNFVGIPTEGYGFSRNVRPKLSVPSFNDVKFSVTTHKNTSIDLIN
ncbi:MAG: DUF2141 domain-containing protein [Saprospiraceae bacterium]